MTRPTVARIDTEALRHNLAQVRSAIGIDTRVMCCVKADAYGHGIEIVSRALDAAGADAFGVASADEGIELRRLGIAAPIQVLGQLTDDELAEAVRAGLTLTVSSLDTARAIDELTRRLDTDATAHLKIDTGMGRLGVRPERAEPLARVLHEAPRIALEGVMTHFAAAEDLDPDTGAEQLALFHKTVDGLAQAGIRFAVRHVANSAAILRRLGTDLEMVRPGIVLYGSRPDPSCPCSLDLRGALSLVSRITIVKDLPAGAGVGYGLTYTTRRPTRMAIVPIGYGDGYFRCLGGRAAMTVRGRHCPVIGRVSMDQTALDVTDVEGVAAGDEVIVYSAQADAPNSIEATAALAGTIPYEITCQITGRVGRRVGGTATLREFRPADE